MIYTITFNPSLDYIVEVNDMKLGMTNRTSYEQMIPGGKGINVSYVLKNLGLESTALGFLAGFTGEEICKRIEEKGIRSDFIFLDEGQSRINVKIRNIDGMEINGMGPDILPEYVDKLMKIVDGLESSDILILAGSIPASVSDNIYKEIMKKLSDKDIMVVVDATKDLLLNVLEHRPFLIKPNNHELGEIFNVKLNTREEVVPYAQKLQKLGARNVLVSMAGEGAVLIDENEKVHMSKAPSGNVVNAVGAGDSMVAGFISGWLEKKDYHYALLKGLATGSASAFSEDFATKDEVDAVLKQLV